MNITIIGAGSFGTALSIVLHGNGHAIKVFDVDNNLIESINKDRINKKYLPEINLPENIFWTTNIKEAVLESQILIFAVPTQNFRKALTNIIDHDLLDDQIIVNVAKGIEQKTLKLIPEITEEFTKNSFVHLAGPSHAEEVCKKIPTALVASSKDAKVSKLIQEVFSTDYLRIYTGDDVIGASLGGAIKNVIALGAGVSDGLGFGDNTKAAILTRGIHEMSKLGTALGADKNTFYGLTGIGDLMVTAMSMHSRNRKCGILIGEGTSVDSAVKQVGMVVEGISTAEAIYELLQLNNIDMPICSTIYDVIKNRIDIKEAAKRLLNREQKAENVIY